jgi:hypothetical protein
MRVFVLLAILSAAAAFARAADDDVAIRASTGDAVAIAQLRAAGPAGVERLLALHHGRKLDERQYRAALDQVCKQRDCAWSRLYWYTDLPAAIAAAGAQHKPILSLRLLGNLDEDLSCANSRFFRTLLYSNRAIADYLRANFILHWSSERAVPKVTIDFGDGRVMQRTLTGNSAHYLLASDGMPLDVVPGLYAPAAFLANVRGMRSLFDDYQTWPPRERAAYLRVYHGARTRRTERGVRLPLVASPPNAWIASSAAMSKSITEAPILTKASFGTGAARAPEWPPQVNDGGVVADLDANSLDLIRAKRGNGDFAAVIANLQRSMAADTLRNQNELRDQIHRWFSENDRERVSFETLNAFVYTSVFLTPRADPWLGLLPADTYTAIDGDGLSVTPR